MNKTKWIFLLVLFIIALPLVDARFFDDGSCESGTQCTICRRVVNDTNGNPIADASCNITIFYPNDTSFGESVMNNNSLGRYCFNISFSEIGEYPSNMFCQFADNTNLTDVADTTFFVASPRNYNNVLHALLVIIPLGLIALARETEIVHFAALGSILLLTFGIVIFRGGFPLLQFSTSLLTNAFAIIVTGLGFYILALTIQEYWYLIEDT